MFAFAQRRRSDWISGRTLQLSAQTTRARSRNDTSVHKLQKLTTMSARGDQQKYWSETVTPMKQAPNVGHTRKLYQIIRQFSGKPSSLSDSVCDVNGDLIAGSPAKVDPWREHFEHFLDFDEQPITPSLSSSAEFHPFPVYAVSCNFPSEDEVADAIQRLYRNRAPGEYDIPAEIYKSYVETLAPWLHEVIEQAWKDTVVPNDWASDILVPVFTKRDRMECGNYRGKSLIDVVAKVLTIIFQ
ncbi:unnamed protein product [Dibothriocephalus latus]|uniref:Reverse transcriptase domain-containing protein n=1 Tax=Dibothriocephalus latus TaxID=60516 RepID=A0A3P6V5G0_DIBLA|nr:unnamed protein product [Dibothriocephalus latus]